MTVFSRHDNAMARDRANTRAGDGRKRATKVLSGVLGGVFLGACMLAAGDARAFTTFSAEEGDPIAVNYSLPTFPHEARRVSTGYSGVRYSLCTSDGTATGAPFSFAAAPGTDYTGMDYAEVCDLTWQLNSTSNYDKYLSVRWYTREDDEDEGDEYFWLKLSNPEVRRPGSSAWTSHQGSHHVPSTITIRMEITDDD